MNIKELGKKKKYRKLIEELHRFEKERKIMLSTQGYKKMWVYFLRVFNTNDFQENVKQIRKEFKIPSRGFKRSENTYSLALEELKYFRNSIFTKKIKDICDKYFLPHNGYKEILNKYIVYNNKIEKNFFIAPINVCIISDLMKGKSDISSATLARIEENREKESKENEDRMYPIAIKVSAYASERDIQNFIVKTYPIIKSLQEKYKDPRAKIGKVRLGSKEKRNDFIYKHKKLPKKELMKLVNKKYKEVLDIGLIGKIISIENKRRKQL